MQAGIPDFRSPEGLFQTLKRDNPRESLTSGKDLFDASVFNVSALFWLLRDFCLVTSFNAPILWVAGYNLRNDVSHFVTEMRL